MLSYDSNVVNDQGLENLKSLIDLVILDQKENGHIKETKPQCSKLVEAEKVNPTLAKQNPNSIYIGLQTERVENSNNPICNKLKTNQTKVHSSFTENLMKLNMKGPLYNCSTRDPLTLVSSGTSTKETSCIKSQYQKLDKDKTKDGIKYISKPLISKDGYEPWTGLKIKNKIIDDLKSSQFTAGKVFIPFENIMALYLTFKQTQKTIELQRHSTKAIDDDGALLCTTKSFYQTLKSNLSLVPFPWFTIMVVSYISKLSVIPAHHKNESDVPFVCISLSDLKNEMLLTLFLIFPGVDTLYDTMHIGSILALINPKLLKCKIENYKSNGICVPFAYLIDSLDSVVSIGEANDFTFCQGKDRVKDDMLLSVTSSNLMMGLKKQDITHPCPIPLNIKYANKCEKHVLKLAESRQSKRPELSSGYITAASGDSLAVDRVSLLSDSNIVFVYNDYWLNTKGECTHRNILQPLKKHKSITIEETSKTKELKEKERRTILIGKHYQLPSLNPSNPLIIKPDALKSSACCNDAIKKMGFDPSFDRRKSFFTCINSLPTPQLGRDFSKNKDDYIIKIDE